MQRLVVLSMGILSACLGAGAAGARSPYAQWARGPDADPAFFPIAVWLQSPDRAPAYRAIGINTYVGLWEGPTAGQLEALRRHGMRVICAQNAVGLEHLDDPTIVGWMHGDEPDNAQPDGRGGYGPPIAPERIVEAYRRMTARDPSRPVLLNLGQGVAWDGWYGRGVRTNHPEDYPAYARGGDILSFDIYPVNAAHEDVRGHLWRVPYGVDRLREWAGAERIVWNCIECTRIGGTGRRPTPREVRAQVWLSLVHGSRGLIYFVHEFAVRDGDGEVVRPFTEAGLLRDREMAEAVGAINRQVAELAPVLNAPPPARPPVTATCDDPDVPVDVLSRAYRGDLYVLAAAARPGRTTVSFRVHAELPPAAEARVLGEDRTLPVTGASFTDAFASHDVHLYRIVATTP